MTEAQIARQVAALPQDAQRFVLDVIATLRSKPVAAQPGKLGRTKKTTPLRNERFVGIWRDREEMADSSAWVRSVREREWNEGLDTLLKRAAA